MDILTTDAEESSLLARARNGETHAFKILYESQVEPLYRFLKQFEKKENDAEEWTQRAFIKAFEGLSRFDGRAKFRTWLFQIGLNEMRSDARRNGIVTFVAADEIGEKHSENSGEMLEWNSTLRTVFERLDETKRAVFILYEVEGYSHAEIASLLMIKESTSRTILTRTKQWLRNQLQ